jgi:hypothetical protein
VRRGRLRCNIAISSTSVERETKLRIQRIRLASALKGAHSKERSMRSIKKTLVAGVLAITAGVLLSSSAQAQVFIGPPLVGPRVVARAIVPPVPVVRPVVRPVVAATYVTPVVRTYGYTAYRPSYVTPAVVAPVVRTTPVVVTTRLRPAYVPFQPVRNRVRFARW